MKRKKLALLAGVMAGGLVLSACGSGSGAFGDGKTQLSYWLWDSLQLPGYQKCADGFEKKNPDIKINIEQRGWDDYWTGITFGMVSESAPDVFTDHVQKYPDYANRGLLLPINKYVKRDHVDMKQYAPGLADLWVGPKGERYGLPKDWDTVSVFYNADMVKKAGMTADEMNHLTWNPKDGGTYEKMLARLTVDKNGKHGDEPGFNKHKIKTYGMWMDATTAVGGGVAQTQWSMYSGTTGWEYTNKNPWGTHYNYDDPKFLDTIAWYKRMIDKGYMPSFTVTKGLQWSDQMAAGRVATNTNGSWLISTAYGYDGLKVATAPTPVGPDGKRSSMFNGLADSIYKGTKHPEEAWQWVKYLGSSACQDVIAKQGVVFPAINTAWEKAQKTYAKKHIDVSSFTDQVRDKTTFTFPITDHAADRDAIMEPAMQAVLLGQKPVKSLVGINQQVNNLFKK